MNTTADFWQAFRQALHFVFHVAELFILYFLALIAAQAIAPESVTAYFLASFLFIPLILLCIVIHEMGHVIAGALSGFRIHYIRVLWFLYRPHTNKFAVTPREMQKFSGGAVFATSDAPFSRVKSLLYVGGGPAFSLSLALMFPIAHQFQPPLSHLLNGLATMSCVVGLFTLIPVWWSNVRATDGAKLLEILFGAPPKTGSLLFLRLLGAYLEGVALREVNASLVANVECEDIDDKYRDARDEMVASYCFCCGELRRAEILLRQNQSVLDGSAPSLTISYAFLKGILDADGEGAEALLRKIPLNSRTGFHYFRALAVSQHLLKYHSDAQEAANIALHSASHDGAVPDEEDRQLFAAIQKQEPLPDFEHIH